MKKILLLTAIIFNVLIVSAQRFEWLSTSRQYNSNSNIPVSTDAAGNVYTMIDIDPTLNCIIQGDTIYPVVPGTNGTIVVKYGPTGNFIWGKRIDPDGGGINGGRIVVDNAGSVYASVSFSNGGSVHLIDTVCTPSPPAYAHIIKLSSSGNFVRIKSYSNGTFISPPILACLGTDIYTGTANYLQKLDSAFNTIWNFTDPTNAIQFAHTGDSKAEIYVQANGELVVSAWEFGNTIGNIPFSDDTVHWHVGGLDEGAILKLDTSGHVLWSRTFSCDNFHPGIRAVCLDAQNNAYLGLEGYTYNAQTIFGSDTLINTRGTGDYSAILKWDSSGNPVRAIPLYPLASAPDLRELAVNAQSDLLVSGMIGSSQLYTDSNDSIMGYGNFFLIKYDSAGIYKWYKTEAHNTSTFVDGIAVRYGNQYVLGGSTGTATQYQFDCIPDPTISCTNWVTVVSELPVLNPNASFTFTNVDSVYTFIDQSQNAISWHWDFGDGDTSNLQNPTHPFVTGSSYTVVLTVTNGGCTSIDTLHIIDVGIREISSPDSFSIFPNPTTGNFIITAMKSIDKVSIEVNNVLGENVFEETCFLSSKTEINLKNISAGIYFVKVYNGAKVFTQKLLIE